MIFNLLDYNVNPRRSRQALHPPPPPCVQTFDYRESVFSVDVEDWFHILQLPSGPDLSAWKALPSRVEANFMSLLHLFEKRDVRVTCFFLGWIAERFPHLVREAVRRGHEIASHGYAHRLIFELTREQFTQDAKRSRLILEDIAGVRVRGYRAAGFSVTPKMMWPFDALIEAGYEYDSSVFPARRQHGGMRGAPRAPFRISRPAGVLTEFPVSVTDLCGKAFCLFGGGYLRFFPYWLIRREGRRILRDGRPVVFYIHPREIDPQHPRLAMPPIRRFKSYVNLHTTRAKIEQITNEFTLVTFADYLTRYGKTLQVRMSQPEDSRATPAFAVWQPATRTALSAPRLGALYPET
jgi:polysaccharide deacetylase family protein (PEP-CTERM system associated)